MMWPPIGMSDIVSKPPATITSAPPARIRSAAIAMDWRPDEQKRLMVIALVSTGSPARMAAARATFIPCSASGIAQPMTTSSISDFSNPSARRTASSMTAAPISSGRVFFSVPFGAFPTAVRTAETTTASRINNLWLKPRPYDALSALLDGDLDLFGVQHVLQDPRVYRDEEAALAAVDVDLRQIKNRALGVDVQVRARAEGAGAADEVAGVLLRLREVARVDGLHPHVPREVLRRDLAVAVHQDEEGALPLRLHHERLDDRVLVHAQSLGRVACPAALDVVVEVRGELDLLLA